MTGKLESFSKWLQLKHYQFEVTLGVYMYTPGEKFFFYSVLFLLLSLTFIATVLYLPQHLQFILSRAWFYVHGEALESTASELVKAAAARGGMLSSATTAAADATVGAAKEL
ncbi:hypothetical protein VTK26DRAFT_8073 [Humicola hyalothermophila]